MSTPFDQARQQGYSDTEIFEYLQTSPAYSDKISKAREQGYSDVEIQEFISSSPAKEERGAYEKVVERPAQLLGKSIISGARAAPRTGFELLKTVVEATGGDISKLEEAQANAPEALKTFASSAFPTFEEEQERQSNLNVFGSEKKVAQAETPVERGIEKFGRFVGESPAFGGLGGGKGLVALGGLAAGSQYGEEAELGPGGQIATGLIGALAPSALISGGRGLVQGAKALRKSPKEALARGVAKVFTPKDKVALSKEIIKNARESGVQLDLGTMTNSNVVKSIQAKLAQSGLTGKALDDLKKTLSEQVVNEYKAIGENLGKAEFETIHDAGEAVQKGLKVERDFTKSEYNKAYKQAREALPENATVYPDRVIKVIEKLEKDLKPGSLKGSEQKAVLKFLEDIKKDVMTPEGRLKSANVNDLINNKVAIHDIVNYEVQGGSKKLLNLLARELDKTVQQYGRESPDFARLYKAADKQFAEAARTFRNKNIAAALKTQDPRTILSKMNTTQGIRDIKKALSGSEEGRELFDHLSRFKLDQLIEKNLQSGLEGQIQFGRLGSSLKKGNNKEILRELLGKEGFPRLEKLLKTSTALAESANKFLNTSKTATTIVDFGTVSALIKGVGMVLHGNPMTLVATGVPLLAARQTSKLIANPEFLRLVEDAILASKSGNVARMEQVAKPLLEKAKEILKTVSRETPDAVEKDQA